MSFTCSLAESCFASENIGVACCLSRYIFNTFGGVIQGEGKKQEEVAQLLGGNNYK